VAFGFIVNGLSVPGQSETHLLTALEGIPGSIIGIGVMIVLGRRSQSSQ